MISGPTRMATSTCGGVSGRRIGALWAMRGPSEASSLGVADFAAGQAYFGAQVRTVLKTVPLYSTPPIGWQDVQSPNIIQGRPCCRSELAYALREPSHFNGMAFQKADVTVWGVRRGVT